MLINTLTWWAANKFILCENITADNLKQILLTNLKSYFTNKLNTKLNVLMILELAIIICFTSIIKKYKSYFSLLKRLIFYYSSLQ